MSYDLYLPISTLASRKPDCRAELFNFDFGKKKKKNQVKKEDEGRTRTKSIPIVSLEEEDDGSIGSTTGNLRRRNTTLPRSKGSGLKKQGQEDDSKSVISLYEDDYDSSPVNRWRKNKAISTTKSHKKKQGKPKTEVVFSESEKDDYDDERSQSPPKSKVKSKKGKNGIKSNASTPKKEVSRTKPVKRTSSESNGGDEEDELLLSPPGPARKRVKEWTSNKNTKADSKVAEVKQASPPPPARKKGKASNKKNKLTSEVAVLKAHELSNGGDEDDDIEAQRTSSSSSSARRKKPRATASTSYKRIKMESDSEMETDDVESQLSASPRARRKKAEANNSSKNGKFESDIEMEEVLESQESNIILDDVESQPSVSPRGRRKKGEARNSNKKSKLEPESEIEEVKNGSLSPSPRSSPAKSSKTKEATTTTNSQLECAIVAVRKLSCEEIARYTKKKVEVKEEVLEESSVEDDEVVEETSKGDGAVGEERSAEENGEGKEENSAEEDDEGKEGSSEVVNEVKEGTSTDEVDEMKEESSEMGNELNEEGEEEEEATGANDVTYEISFSAASPVRPNTDSNETYSVSVSPPASTATKPESPSPCASSSTFTLRERAQKVEPPDNFMNGGSDEDVTLVISERHAEYMALRNSHITQNMVSVPPEAIRQVASYLTPDMCESTVLDECSSVSSSMVDISDSAKVGYYKIQGKTIRPPHTVQDCMLLFWVISGAITVRSCGGYSVLKDGTKLMYGRTLEKGACLYVPRGTTFTVENWRTDEAVLGYCAMKAKR